MLKVKRFDNKDFWTYPLPNYLWVDEDKEELHIKFYTGDELGVITDTHRFSDIEIIVTEGYKEPTLLPYNFYEYVI